MFMESVWRKEARMNAHETLRGDLKTEVLVIGGGMAGLLCAYLLTEKNIPCTLIEAGRIAGGVTQNTTAKITAQHGLVYSKIMDNYGIDAAYQYAGANLEAIDKYQNIIEKRSIDCEFKRIPAFLYALEDSKSLEQEYQAAASVYIHAALTDKTTLPFPVKTALRFENQAQFNPLDFLSSIAGEISIYENTRALSIDGHVVKTPTGDIFADQIIMATHFPFINAPGYYFMRMHQDRSYVIALEGGGQLDGAYLGIDGDRLSFRNYKNILFLGGGGHRTGDNEGGGKYDGLEKVSHVFYPDSREICRWSAQDCMTHDQIPFIGKFSSAFDNLYVATGFNKWGMTSSMVAAMLLSDEIVGRDKKYDIFSPRRHDFIPSAKGLIADGTEAVTGILKQKLTIPDDRLDLIAPGSGGIVELDGEKTGVYKNEDGIIYGVSTKCPHMGCQLSWNPDERSWDCPCHGSRFDYRGKLINNPSRRDAMDKTACRMK